MSPEAVTSLRIADFTYHLPEEKIALVPLEKRDASRLLFYNRGHMENRAFTDLPSLVQPGSMLVFNNTRVIAARLMFKKPTGARIEIFCLEPQGLPIEQALHAHGTVEWQCMIGGASKWKPGQVLSHVFVLEDRQVHLTATYIRKEPDHFIIRFEWEPRQFDFSEVLREAGAVPLPPYIKRKPEELDEERYQTIFGIHEGSVAAPTASLHFTPAVLEKLAAKQVQQSFVTLHVGAGTFKPVKSETIGEHQMHGEVFTVNRQLIEDLVNAENVIAVGTTSLRTLESLYWLGVQITHSPPYNHLEVHQWDPYTSAPETSCEAALQNLLHHLTQTGKDELQCRTSLIIVPGYRFRIVDELITNFHQPQSTLLLLVAAFIGDDWKRVYDHALENNYRFLSYGDSSYLRPGETQL